MGEVYTALRGAKCGLTEGGIAAVVTLRRHRAILAAMEDLVLMGKLDAERRPDVPSDAVPDIDDFIYHALSENEQAERRKPRKWGESGDELAF